MDPFSQPAYVAADLTATAEALDRLLLTLPADSPAGLLTADALDRVAHAEALLATGRDRITLMLARRSVTAAVDALATVEHLGVDPAFRRARSSLQLSHAGLR